MSKEEESINVKNYKEITTKDSSEKCRKITNNMKAVVQQLLQQHRKVLEIQKLDKSHTKLYCAKKRYHFTLLSNMKYGIFQSFFWSDALYTKPETKYFSILFHGLSIKY